MMVLEFLSQLCTVLAIVAGIATGMGIVAGGIYLFTNWWGSETFRGDLDKAPKFVMGVFFTIALICVALLIFIGLIGGIIKNV